MRVYSPQSVSQKGNRSVGVRMEHKLESASNGRGHTRWRGKAVAELRSYTRLLVRPIVGRWVEPDPDKAEKARQRTADRVLGKKVAAYQLDPVRLTTSLVVTMTRVAPRALDDDNLRGAFKAVRDAIADVLGSDDRNPLIAWRYEQRKGAPKQHAIEIRIERKAKVAA